MDVGAPAVVAAIHDATGVWIHDLPATPERILAAMTHRTDASAARGLGRAARPEGPAARGSARRRRRDPASLPHRPAAGLHPVTYRFSVNGSPVEVEAPGMRRLLDVLREDLALTGTKEGCGEGECGACSVLIDGALVDACLVPVCQVEGAIGAHGRGPGQGRRAQRPAGGLPGDRRRAVRHLHAGHADGRRGLPGIGRCAEAKTRFATRSPATCAAAPATPRSSTPSRWPPSAAPAA